MGLALTFDITFEPRHAMFIASVNPDSASPSLSLPRRPFVYSIRIRRKRCVLLSLERKNRQYPLVKMIHPSMVEASWTSKMAEGERETGMTDIPRHDLLRHRCPSNSIRGTRFCIPSYDPRNDRSIVDDGLVDHGWNRGRSWNCYYPSTRSSLLLRELYTPRSLLAIR